MTRHARFTTLGLLGLVAAGLTTAALAQSTGTGDSAANEPAATQPDRPDGGEAGSGEVMKQLLEQRDNEPVEPEQTPAGNQPAPDNAEQVDMPAVRSDMDQSVLGTAPGGQGEKPELRREGDFLINRRGHMVRSNKTGRLMFVFKGDGKQSPEPPMVLQACRTLQNMEKIVEDRGQSVEFIISGRVHTYRGANYLLPTMMKIAESRSNLKE